MNKPVGKPSLFPSIINPAGKHNIIQTWSETSDCEIIMIYEPNLLSILANLNIQVLPLDRNPISSFKDDKSAQQDEPKTTIKLI